MTNYLVRKLLLGAIFVACCAIFISFSFYSKNSFVQEAEAHPICQRCPFTDCTIATFQVSMAATQSRIQVNAHIDAQFPNYRVWVYEVFWKQNLLPAMMMMTEQLSAVGLHQMLAVGQIIDAKVELETQRDLNILKAEAVNDYHPSEDFCAFGTNVQSLAHSNSKSEFSAQAINSYAMSRFLGTANISGSDGSLNDAQDKKSRWHQFVDKYCNVYNNNWDPRLSAPDQSAITGLVPACSPTASGGSPSLTIDVGRVNADIHYSRTIGQNRTVTADFTDSTLPASIGPGEPTEEAILALSKNLYGHRLPTRSIANLNEPSGEKAHYELRRITAMRSAAQNSYNAIAALKLSGTAKHGSVDVRQYMASIMKNLGMSTERHIQFMLNSNPSYYAQLEILAKRIFQSPNFYANLYDKPQNVKRISVALRAIELMLDREMYESRLRQEMLASVMIPANQRMDKDYRKIAEKLSLSKAE